MQKLKMKEKKNPEYDRFAQFIKSSGYRGKISDFANEFLNTDRFGLYYAMRSGGLNDTQKFMLVEKLKDGNNRSYGIQDEALALLEKILEKNIPRGDSDNITAKGENINIKNTTITQGESIDYKALYEEAKELLLEKDKNILLLKGEIAAYKNLYEEEKRKNQGKD